MENKTNCVTVPTLEEHNKSFQEQISRYDDYGYYVGDDTDDSTDPCLECMATSSDIPDYI